MGILFIAPLGYAQKPAGSVTGRVFNIASESYVANARVEIVGSTVAATTDDSGTYVLYGVPAGEAMIQVDYVGFKAPAQVVSVGEGAITLPDFNLMPVGGEMTGEKVHRLDKFTVVADKELSAQAIAMNEQRNSASLKNVVAMDEYPEGSTGNIGEFLKYVPGLAIVYSGNAPLDVSVRGLPGNTTTITVDGAELPTAFPSATRGSSLFGVPFANASWVEVTKMPTPDVPAASLGGSINIVSRSGFQQKKRLLTYDIYTTFRADESLSEQPAHIDAVRKSRLGPSFNVSYVQPLSESLSVTLGGGYIYNYVTLDTTAPTYNLVRGVQTSSQITYGQQLQRTANYNVGVDWKLDDNNVFKFTGQSRKRDAISDNAGLQVIFGDQATGDRNFTQGVATGSGGVAQIRSAERLVMDTKSGNLSHTFRNRLWKIESSFSYSKAVTYNGVPEGSFRSGTFRNAGNVIVVGSGIDADPWGLAWDVLPTVYTATNRTGQPVDIFDQSQLLVSAATLVDLHWDRTNEQFKTMATRQLETKIPVTIKAGFQRNKLGYESTGSTLTYAIQSATAGTYGLVSPAYTIPFAGHDLQVVDPVKLYNLSRTSPQYFTLNEAAAWQSEVSAFRDLEETVTAGFLRLDAKLFDDRLWLVGGVRYEHTQDEGVGPRVDPSASLRKDANGNLLRTPASATIPITTNPLEVAKLQYTKGGAYTDRSYDSWYPSLNSSFIINKNLLLRLGYAKTIGRPDLSVVIPGTTFNAVTANPRTITVNNSGLNPWSAHNYDATLESYLFKDGSGSVGVFQKDITGFFEAWQTPATPELLDLYGISGVEDVDYVVITRRNGSGETRIRGFEFNYKQKLTFLPESVRGLEVFLNYTKLDLQGSALSDFTGFNPQTLSYGVNLTRPRFSVRFLIQTQGEVRRTPVAASATTGIPEGTYLWQEPKTRPTLAVTYKLSRNLSLYGTLTDFFGDGFVDRQFRYPDGSTVPEYSKIQRIIEMGTQATIGIKGQF
jgi:iron complex outermembrane recepter protein